MNININKLSQHLFWDVDRLKINFEKNKVFIIKRVLDYGLISDWNIIYNYYGIKEIGSITTKIRGLDMKSVYFISTLSKIPIEKFICYTTKQSIPKHWNF